MMEWIVTSSALILIVIALRGILKGRISLKLQYGLWALVLVRLLVPFSIVDSAISVSNILTAPAIREADIALTDYRESYEAIQQDAEARGEAMTDDDIRAQVQRELFDRTYSKSQQVLTQSGTPVQTPEVQTELRAEVQQQVQVISLTAVVTEALPYLWIIGMIAVAAALICSNLHFGWKLRQSRKALDIPGVPLNTYLTDYVATPCLFGLVKPDIYLTAEVVTDTQLRRHVIAHEMSHYRQGDHIWSMLRCICLVLHWYNPLVWVAAVLSKKDAELACDEATIKTLGENERTAYGHTLIGMTCVRRNPRSLMLTATTMLGTKKTLKERISLIAKKPKTALYTLIACILVASLAVGCTFTGVPTEPSTEPSTVPTDGPTSEPTDPSTEPTEAQNPVALLEQCRLALEELQSRDSFELIQEVSSSNPDGLVAFPQTSYIHHDGDWVHIKEGADSKQMYLQIDNRQYVKFVTRAIPEEDRVYPNWTETDLSIDPFASHCWLMELQWDADSTVFHKLESDGTANEIFVYVHHGDDTRDLYSFRFSIDSGALLSVTMVLHDDDGHLYTNRVTVAGSIPDEHLQTILKYELEAEMENAEDLMLIQQFQDLLSYENGYWYWRAMGCIFDKPENIDMSLLCYIGMKEEQLSSTFTDDEIAFLKTRFIGNSGDDSPWSNAHKLPRAELEAVMQTYFGISLEDVDTPWVYYSETDAYYHVKYDAYGLHGYTVTSVVTDDDGLIYVYWTVPYGLWDTRHGDELLFLENPQMVMVLEENEEGGFLIRSNLPVLEMLPQNYTLNDVVVINHSVWNFTEPTVSGNQNAASVDLPVIVPFSQDAIAVQREIDEFAIDNDTFIVESYATLTDGILSVIIKERTYYDVDHYTIYNFDMTTGELLAVPDMVSAVLDDVSYVRFLATSHQYSVEETRNIIKEREAHYRENNMLEFYQRTLNEMENDTLSMFDYELCYTGEGLCLHYAKNELAGARNYPALVSLSGSGVDWNVLTEAEAYDWFFNLEISEDNSDGKAAYSALLLRALFNDREGFVNYLNECSDEKMDQIGLLVDYAIEGSNYSLHGLLSELPDSEAKTALLQYRNW